MAYKKNAKKTDSFMEFRKFFRQEIGLHKNADLIALGPQSTSVVSFFGLAAEQGLRMQKVQHAGFG